MASPSYMRPLIGAVRTSSPCRISTIHRHVTSNRCFSHTSPRRVNLTRPTSRTAATSTAAATKTSASAPASKPITPPKPAVSSQAAQTTAAAATSTTTPSSPATRSLASGLSDAPPDPLPEAAPTTSSDMPVDWSRSFHGLSSEPFSERASAALMAPIDPEDVEIKPDGILYLPEIKYRRILNRAFGPGGWGLAPRGETIVTGKSVTREYGLVVHGRLVSIARGEQAYFDPEGIATATEGCKSNALMRCCKDLGIASELWDPVFIRKFKANHSKEVWVEHLSSKRKKKIVMRKDVDVPPGGFKFS